MSIFSGVNCLKRIWARSLRSASRKPLIPSKCLNRRRSCSRCVASSLPFTLYKGCATACVIFAPCRYRCRSKRFSRTLSISRCCCSEIPHTKMCSLQPSFFFNDTATTEIYTLSLHDALPILVGGSDDNLFHGLLGRVRGVGLVFQHAHAK